MQISEEMEIIVARGILNNGKVTAGTIKSVYSSANRDKCSGILRKLESAGYIRPTKSFGVFRVRVKEIGTGDNKKMVYNVPQEIIDIANTLQEVRDTSAEEDELLKKYKKVDN